MQKILIADDNEKICSILKEYASQHGYECIIAKDGIEAMEAFDNNSVQIVLLDVMMPRLDGIGVCRRIREKSNVPIIMISAKGEEEERILGLDIGADDYITKPFGVNEVMARIRALLRRSGKTENDIVRCKDLIIDRMNHMTTVAGHQVQLTKKEEMLLALLAAVPGKVFTRDEMMEKAWNYDSESSDRAIDTHIKRIRAKIDIYDHPGFIIKTIWGIGYKLEELS